MKVKTILFFLVIAFSLQANPVKGLLERIDPGASRKFVIELQKAPCDFFELDQQGEKVVIRGNNYVSIATGLNWYLKYYAHIHLSWNGMQAKLPAVLPPVPQKERHATSLPYRYDLNYCTYSYSMAFWDWERWEQEIDWMALHGINLPLSLTGMESVWYNVLKKLGYSKDEINEFIAGPGFLAWWHMNNLQGWGGPNPDSWYARQVALEKKIIRRMREYGIEPVFPGYAGMVPHNAAGKLGLNVADPGVWCGYPRPAFLQPADPAFEKISSLYYAEMEKLFGKARYYAIDPFHEGGSTEGVDLEKAGKAILKAMKKANPEAVWVCQAWQANPREEMIGNLAAGDLLVLDLFSESRPMWGDKNSPWYREDGYGKHNWLYCMLLNFGGNVGMHGKMERVIGGFYNALEHPNGNTLQGVGITMEGIENNPAMYELLLELPWRAQRFTKEEWLETYQQARYGKSDPALLEAWNILGNSVYACPDASTQEGTTESVFCARPKEVITSASTWGTSQLYYDPQEVVNAVRLMLSVAVRYRGNANFEYDLTDVVRQVLADKGNLLQKEAMKAYKNGYKNTFNRLSDEFLKLILLQDELLSCQSGFMVGRWLEQAKSLGATPQEKALYEWNARTQVTTWGNRKAADEGGLHDYSHREWAGLLKDFYYPRWKAYFAFCKEKMDGKEPQEIDFYSMEEAWTKKNNLYPAVPVQEVIPTAKRIMREIGLE